MIAELSDDENVRIMVEQMGFSEERARFIVAMERGEIEGDIEAIDGPLTAEDKKRLGIGSIFDAPTRGGGGDGGEAQPAPNKAREMVTTLFRVAKSLMGRDAA